MILGVPELKHFRVFICMGIPCFAANSKKGNNFCDFYNKVLPNGVNPER